MLRTFQLFFFNNLRSNLFYLNCKLKIKNIFIILLNNNYCMTINFITVDFK